MPNEHKNNFHFKKKISTAYAKPARYRLEASNTNLVIIDMF